MSAAQRSECIGFDVCDGVAVLELRRPGKRNAFSHDMLHAMRSHLHSAAARDDVRVLVVQGSAGMFCAGADLGAVKHVEERVAATFREDAVATFAAIASFPVPSVAKISGACIGGGCGIALACDIRLADPTAIFAIPAVRHNIVYDTDSLIRLKSVIGVSRAARMLYTGERVDGRRAADIGLVDDCRTDLEQAVAECVSAIAAADPAIVAAHRELLRGQSPAGQPEP